MTHLGTEKVPRLANLGTEDETMLFAARVTASNIEKIYSSGQDLSSQTRFTNKADIGREE